MTSATTQTALDRIMQESGANGPKLSPLDRIMQASQVTQPQMVRPSGEPGWGQVLGGILGQPGGAGTLGVSGTAVAQAAGKAVKDFVVEPVKDVLAIPGVLLDRLIDGTRDSTIDFAAAAKAPLPTLSPHPFTELTQEMAQADPEKFKRAQRGAALILGGTVAGPAGDVVADVGARVLSKTIASNAPKLAAITAQAIRGAGEGAAFGGTFGALNQYSSEGHVTSDQLLGSTVAGLFAGALLRGAGSAWAMNRAPSQTDPAIIEGLRATLNDPMTKNALVAQREPIAPEPLSGRELAAQNAAGVNAQGATRTGLFARWHEAARQLSDWVGVRFPQVKAIDASTHEALLKSADARTLGEYFGTRVANYILDGLNADEHSIFVRGLMAARGRQIRASLLREAQGLDEASVAEGGLATTRIHGKTYTAEELRNLAASVNIGNLSATDQLLYDASPAIQGAKRKYSEEVLPLLTELRTRNGLRSLVETDEPFLPLVGATQEDVAAGLAAMFEKPAGAYAGYENTFAALTTPGARRATGQAFAYVSDLPTILQRVMGREFGIDRKNELLANVIEAPWARRLERGERAPATVTVNGREVPAAVVTLKGNPQVLTDRFGVRSVERTPAPNAVGPGAEAVRPPQLGAAVPAATRVVDEAGLPKTVYHGTSRSFEEFSPEFANPDALYGHGFYFTEDPAIASKYTAKGTGEAPNIRPARLVVKNPFDADAPLSPQETSKIIDAAIAYHKRVYPRGVEGRQMLEQLRQLHPDGFTKGSQLFDLLARQGLSMHGANNALREAGYDAITHMGGLRGGAPHRVWIAFSKEQIKAPWEDLKAVPKEVSGTAIAKRPLPSLHEVELDALEGHGGVPGEVVQPILGDYVVPKSVAQAIDELYNPLANRNDKLSLAARPVVGQAVNPLFRLMDLATGLQLASPVEASAHTIRILSILSKIPGVGDDQGTLQQLANRLVPYLGPRIGGVRDIFNAYDEAGIKIEHRLAGIPGAIPSRAFGAEVTSGAGLLEKIGVGGAQKALHLGRRFLFELPSQEKGFWGFDVRARVAATKALYRVSAKELGREPTDREIMEFLQQFGAYSTSIQSNIASFLRLNRTNPFAGGESGIIPGEVRALIGKNLPESMRKEMTRAANARVTAEAVWRGAVGTSVALALASRALSGHWPWENEKGHGLDLQVGQLADGRAVYAPMRLLEPGLFRAATITLLRAAYENAGESRAFSEGGRQLANTAITYGAGAPGMQGFATLALGRSPYITGGGELLQIVPPEPTAPLTIKARFLAAVSGANPSIEKFFGVESNPADINVPAGIKLIGAVSPGLVVGKKPLYKASAELRADRAEMFNVVEERVNRALQTYPTLGERVRFYRKEAAQFPAATRGEALRAMMQSDVRRQQSLRANAVRARMGGASP